MSATDFPDPMEFDTDLFVRGNNVCLNDYVIIFPIRAQALAFAWIASWNIARLQCTHGTT